MHYLDANVIISFLTGDDPKRQQACNFLFEQIEKGEQRVFIPDVVIAEVVYVLSSPRTYHHTHQEVAELLTPILTLPHVEVHRRPVLLRALRIYAERSDLDFPDAYLVAAMEDTKEHMLISYDTDFDKFPEIVRREPELEKAA
jgi:predicted nucleic acid-binding protein